jgi:signal transduction histidine kinase
MDPMPCNSAVAVRCGLNGLLKEVIYDQLGLHSELTPGSEFAAMVAPIHLRKATRFLQTVRVTGSALDWELNVALPEGLTPLFFSGCIAGLGVVIIGSREPLSEGTRRKSARHSGRYAIGLAAASKQQDVLKASRPKAERKVQRAGEFPGETPRSDSETGKSLVWLEIAAHDLRNPISGILAATQFLIEDAGRILQAHQVTLLRSIESSSQFVLRLLQDLSEIPALESGKLEFDFYLSDIGALVESAVLANRPLAASKRVNLELMVERPAPTVLADRLKIEHALNTLLSSAVRCSPAEAKLEVRVGARAERAVVTLRCEDPGNLARDLATLFHPSRGGRKPGLSEERAALTLGMAKRIVAGHRGTIQLGAEAAKGSVLTLNLPISAEESGYAQRRKMQRSRVGTSSQQ